MILVPVVSFIARASWLPPSIIIRALESLCLPLGIMESNWKVVRLDRCSVDPMPLDELVCDSEVDMIRLLRYSIEEWPTCETSPMPNGLC